MNRFQEIISIAEIQTLNFQKYSSQRYFLRLMDPKYKLRINSSLIDYITLAEWTLLRFGELMRRCASVKDEFRNTESIKINSHCSTQFFFFNLLNYTTLYITSHKLQSFKLALEISKIMGMNTFCHVFFPAISFASVMFHNHSCSNTQFESKLCMVLCFIENVLILKFPRSCNWRLLLEAFVMVVIEPFIECSPVISRYTFLWL